MKVLIQDDLHHTHCLWLMNKIRLYFGQAYHLEFYDNQTEFSDMDLIISNYYLETGNTPLLLMKNIPTERNWLQLKKCLNTIACEEN